MKIILHLLTGLGISFVGALPMGIINLYVFETAVKQGRLRAFYVALGAVLIEMAQAAAAVGLVNYIYQYPNMAFYTRLFAVPVFLFMGVYQLLQAPKKPQEPDKIKHFAVAQNNAPVWRAFGMGVFLSSINMMAIPYWLFYSSYLIAGGYLISSSPFYVALYIAGIALGSMLVCMFYAQAGSYMAKRFTQNTTTINRVIGCILIALALYTTWQLWQTPLQ